MLTGSDVDLESLTDPTKGGLLTMALDAWPKSARERVGGLVAYVLARVKRASTAASAEEKATVARIGRAVMEWWIVLARSLNVAVEDPPTPCSGPSCVAASAVSACSRCNAAYYCSVACQRCVRVHPLSADIAQGIVADPSASVRLSARR